LFEAGSVSWDQVLKRWKARGPMNDEYVAALQRGWAPGQL
jgi:ring-1,2-phenylacetyl-CoA epoxidase subunit PaaA